MSDKLMIPENGPMNEAQAQDARHCIAKLAMRHERLTTEIRHLRSALISMKRDYEAYEYNGQTNEYDIPKFDTDILDKAKKALVNGTLDG